MNAPPAIIVVPPTVVDTIARISTALGGPVTLIGGWAVTCRLRMARSAPRPTEDVDVVLAREQRPAAAALAAIDALQTDTVHQCRLLGLPLLVDLLADGPDAVATAQSPGASAGGADLVVDGDGLRLIVPPFADLVARCTDEALLSDDNTHQVVRLPRAGALFATKIGTLALEQRQPDKRASDGEDAVRLITAFGVLALVDDLRAASPTERAELARLVELIGGSALSAQARRSGFEVDVRVLTAAVDELYRRLIGP